MAPIRALSSPATAIRHSLDDSQVIQAAYQSRRFAAYIARSLRNFFVDCVRRSQSSKANIEVPFDPTDSQHCIAWTDDETDERVDSDSREYDLLFAQRFLDRLLDRARGEFNDTGQTDVWHVLDRRLVQPALTGTEPDSYATLASTLNLKSPQDASTRLQAGIRSFQRNLRQMAEAHAQMEGHTGFARKAATRGLIERVCRSLTMHGMKLTDFAIRENLSCDTPTSAAPIPKLLFAQSTDQVWTTDDLQEMWRQIIESPMQRLFAKLPLPAEFQTATLLEMWLHENPPLAVLSDIKRYGRENARRQVVSDGAQGHDAQPNAEQAPLIQANQARANQARANQGHETQRQESGEDEPTTRQTPNLPSQLGFVIYVMSRPSPRFDMTR